MAPRIRPYRAQDGAALVELWAACQLTRPWNEPGRDLDRKLAHDAEHLLVAEHGGTVVGSVMVGYDGHRGWLNYLSVRPDQQRRGLGRRLVQEAEARLRDLGCAKVNLQIRRSNLGAVEVYRALGYAVDDVVSMGKRLDTDDRPATDPGDAGAAT